MSESRIQLDGTVDSWFEESLRIMKGGPQIRRSDILLAAVLICSRKHTAGVMLLLANNHKLPAQALLRVLCELYAKVGWCCGVSEGLSDANEVYRRFLRLDFTRVIEHAKILHTLCKRDPSDSQSSEAFEKAEADKIKYQSRGLKTAPNMAEILRELGRTDSRWIEYIKPEIYQDFSGAIHSDMRILRQLVEEDGRVCFKEDVDYSIDRLKVYCVGVAFDINSVIRDHHKGAPESDKRMQDEYEQIMRELLPRGR